MIEGLAVTRRVAADLLPVERHGGRVPQRVPDEDVEVSIGVPKVEAQRPVSDGQPCHYEWPIKVKV